MPSSLRFGTITRIARSVGRQRGGPSSIKHSRVQPLTGWLARSISYSYNYRASESVVGQRCCERPPPPAPSLVHKYGRKCALPASSRKVAF